MLGADVYSSSIKYMMIDLVGTILTHLSVVAIDFDFNASPTFFEFTWVSKFNYEKFC